MYLVVDILVIAAIIAFVVVLFIALFYFTWCTRKSFFRYLKKMFERIRNWIDKWWDRITEFLLMTGVIVLMSYMFFLISILMIVIIKKYI